MARKTDTKSSKELPGFVKRGRRLKEGTTLEHLIKKGMTEVAKYDRRGRIYASGAAFCPRQTVFGSILTSTEIQSAASKGYMSIGSAIEEMITDALYKSDALLFKQYRLPDMGLDMGGYIDAIVWSDSKIRALEIKSCSSIPSKPKPEHIAQALTYSSAIGMPISILYFSRSVANYNGELQMREFQLEFSNESMVSILFNICFSRLCITNNVAPPKPEGWNQKECGYCPFIPICWEGEDVPMDVLSGDERVKLMKRAKDMAENLASNEQVKIRRTGVLNFLEKNGSDFAKKLLKGSNWDELVL